jgi:hypothetical protein
MLHSKPLLIPAPTVVALRQKDLMNGQELFNRIVLDSQQECRSACPYFGCGTVKTSKLCEIFRKTLFKHIVERIVPNFRAIGETLVIPFFDDRYRVARLDKRNLVLLKKIMKREGERDGKTIGGYEDHVTMGYYHNIDTAMVAMIDDAISEGLGDTETMVEAANFKKGLLLLKKTILDKLAEFIIEYQEMEKRAAASEGKKKGKKDKKDDDDE